MPTRITIPFQRIPKHACNVSSAPNILHLPGKKPLQKFCGITSFFHFFSVAHRLYEERGKNVWLSQIAQRQQHTALMPLLEVDVFVAGHLQAIGGKVVLHARVRLDDVTTLAADLYVVDDGLLQLGRTRTHGKCVSTAKKSRQKANEYCSSAEVTRMVDVEILGNAMATAECTIMCSREGQWSITAEQSHKLYSPCNNRVIGYCYHTAVS